MARTVWYVVGELTNPASEPFVILRVDTSVRKGDGVEGVVVSLHRSREEADARTTELTEEAGNAG